MDFASCEFGRFLYVLLVLISLGFFFRQAFSRGPDNVSLLVFRRSAFLVAFLVDFFISYFLDIASCDFGRFLHVLFVLFFCDFLG